MVVGRVSRKLKPNGDLMKIEEALSVMGLLSAKAMEVLAEDLGLDEKKRGYLKCRYVQRLPVADIGDKIFTSERNVFNVREGLLIACKERIIS